MAASKYGRSTRRLWPRAPEIPVPSFTGNARHGPPTPECRPGAGDHWPEKPCPLGGVARAYWVNTYREIKDQSKLDAYARLRAGDPS
jgi:hypothetical protein